MRPPRGALLVLVTLAGGWDAAAAQRRLEVTPALGFYVVPGAVVDESATFPGGPLVMRHISSGLVELGATLWIASRAGLEAQFRYAASEVAVTGAATTRDVSAFVTMVGVRVPMRLSGPRAEWALDVAPGAALVHRGGKAWAGTRGTTDVAFELGIRTAYPLAGAAHLRLELEYLASRVGFDEGLATETQRRVVHELLLTFGLGIRILEWGL